MSKKDRNEGLLNIRQAARLLNVSEVSLRRWTRTGVLACFRVGPKQERRFRREDLEAFLKNDAASAPPGRQRTRQGGSARIEPEGVCIEHGSHVCSLYENDVGRTKLAVPFLLDGLKSGELCFLVAPKEGQDIILPPLESIWPDLHQEIARGRLVVLDGAESGRAMYDYFENTFVNETQAGNRRLRVVGDMAWAVEKRLSIDQLIDFELRYNQFLAHRFPVASLCQYDARKFSGVALLDALKCHEDTFQHGFNRFLN